MTIIDDVAKAFLKPFIPTDLDQDPVPLKVYRNSIQKDEAMGQAVHWGFCYLNDRNCPMQLNNIILRNVRTDIENRIEVLFPSDPTGVDAIDAAGQPPASEPLNFMHAVVSTVDGIVAKLKDVETDEDLFRMFPECASIGARVNDESAETKQKAYEVCCFSMKNTRRTNEDKITVFPNLSEIFDINHDISYFAVFDGHNGADAASYAAAQLHQLFIEDLKSSGSVRDSIINAFNKTDERFLDKCKTENIKSGTTVVAAFIEKDRLFVAWVGDSQATLFYGQGETKDLVVSHKPERPDERERIERSGGEVIQLGEVWRVNGHLAVSRSLGDSDYKSFVIGTPELIEIKTDEIVGNYVVLGSDGLWDVMNASNVQEFVDELIVEDRASESARLLSLEAKGKGSPDNISVIVVFLQPTDTLRKLLQSRPAPCNQSESEDLIPDFGGKETKLNQSVLDAEKPLPVFENGGVSGQDLVDLSESEVKEDVDILSEPDDEWSFQPNKEEPVANLLAENSTSSVNDVFQMESTPASYPPPELENFMPVEIIGQSEQLVPEIGEDFAVTSNNPFVLDPGMTTEFSNQLTFASDEPIIEPATSSPSDAPSEDTVLMNIINENPPDTQILNNSYETISDQLTNDFTEQISDNTTKMATDEVNTIVTESDDILLIPTAEASKANENALKLAEGLETLTLTSTHNLMDSFDVGGQEVKQTNQELLSQIESQSVQSPEVSSNILELNKMDLEHIVDITEARSGEKTVDSTEVMECVAESAPPAVESFVVKSTDSADPSCSEITCKDETETTKNSLFTPNMDAENADSQVNLDAVEVGVNHVTSEDEMIDNTFLDPKNQGKKTGTTSKPALPKKEAKHPVDKVSASKNIVKVTKEAAAKPTTAKNATDAAGSKTPTKKVQKPANGAASKHATGTTLKPAETKPPASSTRTPSPGKRLPGRTEVSPYALPVLPSRTVVEKPKTKLSPLERNLHAAHAALTIMEKDAAKSSKPKLAPVAKTGPLKTATKPGGTSGASKAAGADITKPPSTRPAITKTTVTSSKASAETKGPVTSPRTRPQLPAATKASSMKPGVTGLDKVQPKTATTVATKIGTKTAVTNIGTKTGVTNGVTSTSSSQTRTAKPTPARQPPTSSRPVASNVTSTRPLTSTSTTRPASARPAAARPATVPKVITRTDTNATKTNATKPITKALSKPAPPVRKGPEPVRKPGSVKSQPSMNGIPQKKEAEKLDKAPEQHAAEDSVVSKPNGVDSASEEPTLLKMNIMNENQEESGHNISIKAHDDEVNLLNMEELQAPGLVHPECIEQALNNEVQLVEGEGNGVSSSGF